MKKSINLSLGPKRTDAAYKKLFAFSFVFFIVTAVLSLTLIGYRLFLGSQYSSLERKEQQLNSQLLALVDRKDKLLETKSRLSDIKKIISTRAPIVQRIDTISEVLPATSQVNAISGTDADLEITLESENLSSLNLLVEQKIEEITLDSKKGIKKIEMRSFNLNPQTLRYVISFGIQFN